MASVRCRNGRWYYRITVSKAGKKKYIEHGGFDSAETAIEASRSLNKALLGYETSVGLYNYEKLVNEAFRRFPEGHPYISRVFRGKEGHMENVDPEWSWSKWCSRKNLLV